MTSEKDLTNQSGAQSWYRHWNRSNSWRVMAHLAAALGSYGFLILHLLLCKTPTPCNTWINTHVFVLHPFWIHSARNVVQAHQKPVFWRQQEPPGENRSDLWFRVSCVSGSYGYIHSTSWCTAMIHRHCNPRKYAEKISGVLGLPGRMPAWTGLTASLPRMQAVAMG